MAITLYIWFLKEQIATAHDSDLKVDGCFCAY
jgi:hypothetical protein